MAECKVIFKADGNYLERYAVPKHGNPYTHRCPRRSFEQITHAIDELGDRTFTLESLAAAEGLPKTQVATALAFLKDIGVIRVLGHTKRAAVDCVHLEAMVEYYALAEKASEA